MKRNKKKVKKKVYLTYLSTCPIKDTSKITEPIFIIFFHGSTLGTLMEIGQIDIKMFSIQGVQVVMLKLSV